jgi:hypothetical protein
MVVRDYPYATELGDLACGGGFLWASKPQLGQVVELRLDTLADVYNSPGIGRATSIAYRSGGIPDDAGAIWVLDAATDEIVGITTIHHWKLGPFPVSPGAEQILYVDRYLWVLDPSAQCLQRFDFGPGNEIAPGVPVGPGAHYMSEMNGVIYVLNDRSVVSVDSLTVSTVGLPVIVGSPGSWLADANDYSGFLTVVDAARAKLISLGPSEQAAHAGHNYQPGPSCPTT